MPGTYKVTCWQYITWGSSESLNIRCSNTENKVSASYISYIFFCLYLGTLVSYDQRHHNRKLKWHSKIRILDHAFSIRTILSTRGERRWGIKLRCYSKLCPSKWPHKEIHKISMVIKFHFIEIGVIRKINSYFLFFARRWVIMKKKKRLRNPVLDHYFSTFHAIKIT